MRASATAFAILRRERRLLRLFYYTLWIRLFREGYTPVFTIIRPLLISGEFLILFHSIASQRCLVNEWRVRIIEECVLISCSRRQCLRRLILRRQRPRDDL